MDRRADVALYIDPPSDHFLEDRLFDPRTNPLVGDHILAPYLAVRDHFVARGIPVSTADQLADGSPGARKVYVSIGRIAELERVRQREDTVASAYFAMESPVVEPSLFRQLPEVEKAFRRIFSWSDAESLEPFVGRRIRCQHFSWPQSYDAVHEHLWARRDRAFLVMINANKLPRLYHQELYTQRIKAVELFHRSGEIDLYGKRWGRAPMWLGKSSWVPWTVRRLHERLWEIKQGILPDPVYAACAAASRGIAESKSETLAGYTFALCFENTVLKGYITEKIFDCLFAGTIPVYWGAPDILEWVPGECFIDMRRFEGFAELRDFLHGLSAAEIDGYREAARAYVASPRFDPFRRQAFVDLFRRIVREDTGIDV